MSTTTISPAGLTLHGIAQKDEQLQPTCTPAILFTLSDSLLEDVKKASGVQGGLQFVTGHAPKIRLGKRTIDLTISTEAFRHELYRASSESLQKLQFTGVVSHRAELSVPERKQSMSSDAAVAALQSRLATFKQEKEAKAVNISSNVVAEPKNRWEAAREQKQARRRGLLGHHAASPNVGASSAARGNNAPTSLAFDDSAARMQAMKTPLVHLLAIRPLSREAILEKTRIPKDDLDDVLGKIGKQEQGKWQLTDRAYKELDVWKFTYNSQEDRQAAVDNAIKAYDRSRLAKDEKLWQKLLPEQDRDKGVVLSKLHLATSSTNAAGSPLGNADGAEDGTLASTSNTPRLGPAASNNKAATGKNSGGGAGGGGGALSKRLFGKDPKKRAAEENKEKKRKEREAALAAAAASDREGGKPPPRKKQTTRTNNPKVKSAEIVHSSSEESEGEIKEASTNIGNKQPKASAIERKPTTIASRSRPVPVDSVSPNPNDAPAKAARSRPIGAITPRNTNGAGTPGAPRSAPGSSTKPTKPSTLGKSTPNGLAAPTSQNRSALSPQKSTSRPKVPSPLGAARPRVASDVSDRGAVGVQRVKQGANTPKGLGITNAVRKRQNTVTSTDSYLSARAEQTSGEHSKIAGERPYKSGMNGVSQPRSLLNDDRVRKEGSVTKRKALESPYAGLENGHTTKHRKTESSSSNSQKSSVGASSSIDNRLERSASSDSASSIINEITFSQGVNIAQKFRDEYYPRYAKLYDEQAAKERRGETVPREERDRLWTMHRRLEQMKREIRAASLREHLDE